MNVQETVGRSINSAMNDITNLLTATGFATMLTGGGLFVFINRKRTIEFEPSDAPPPRRTVGRHGYSSHSLFP